MQGPSEFTISGILKGYNSTSALSNIKIPTLFTCGEFDEVGPDVVKSHAALTPKSQFKMLAGSAHITQWDARDENLRVVREFLRGGDPK
jgi:proline iminopeptidase